MIGVVGKLGAPLHGHLHAVLLICRTCGLDFLGILCYFCFRANVLKVAGELAPRDFLQLLALFSVQVRNTLKNAQVKGFPYEGKLSRSD